MAQQRSFLGNLFFLKRRPYLGGPHQEWTPPPEPEYQRLLRDHNFITIKDLEAYIQQQPQQPPLTLNDFPTIKRDLGLLNGEQYLHHYFRHDHAAQHYQNDYYLYNWLFALGAFATALFSVLSLSSIFSGFVTVLWFAATVVSSITTLYTLKNRSEAPQRAWYINRRRAEGLRSNYFLFLAQVPPFHRSRERVRALLELVIQISRLGMPQRGDENRAGNTPPPMDFTRTSHTREETEFLRYIYLEKRVEFQEDFYTNRINEFSHNNRFVLFVAGLLMTISTILAALNTVTTQSTISIIVVLLPSLAAMVIAFQQMYRWEPQRVLYEETLAQLRQARIPLIAEETLTQRELADTIIACERVLGGESDQWGQDVIKSAPPDSQEALADAFEALLDKSTLNEDQKAQVYSILSAGQPPKPPTQQQDR